MRALRWAFDGLASGRRIGSPVLERPDVLKLTSGTHVIFYRLSDGSVDVVRVLHQSMDVDRRL